MRRSFHEPTDHVLREQRRWVYEFAQNDGEARL
jgi:hypothetical protein